MMAYYISHFVRFYRGLNHQCFSPQTNLDGSKPLIALGIACKFMFGGEGGGVGEYFGKKSFQLYACEFWSGWFGEDWEGLFGPKSLPNQSLQK